MRFHPLRLLAVFLIAGAFVYLSGAWLTLDWGWVQKCMADEVNRVQALVFALMIACVTSYWWLGGSDQ